MAAPSSIFDGGREQPPRVGSRLLARVTRRFGYLLILIAFAGGAPLFYCFARVRVLTLDPPTSRRVTRSIIHTGVCLLFQMLKITGLLRIVEEHSQSCSYRYNGETGVIVANHPSMIDALFFLSRFPQVVCVMKAPLLRVPVIGGFARAAGYLPYQETPELWQRAKAARDDGACILIFPEGTRSPTSGLGEFKRGAARIALELELPLLPYVLEMNPLVLGRESPWWRPPAEVIELRVTHLPMLFPQRPTQGEGAETPSDGNRRESIRLTACLEVLINSSVSSTQEPNQGTLA